MKSKAKLSLFWKSTILCLTFLMNLTLGYQLFISEQGVFAWQDLQERYEQMQTDLENINTQKAELSNEIRLLQNDNAYVEKLIRQRLNYVKDGELLYLFEKEDIIEHSPWVDSADTK